MSYREDAMSNMRKSHPVTLLAAGIFFCLACGSAGAQQSYKSADEAVDALVKAARSDNSKGLIAVLGRNGREIIESGDSVADKNIRDAFLVAYNTRHQLVSDDPKKSILLIGEQDWPFPIPIIRKDGGWEFNTDAGREEVLYRRIGRNELNTIQVCLAYVDAQNDYAAMNPSGGKEESYAQRIISSPGKKDGLYWPASANEKASPLGEAAAEASAEGYRLGDGPAPYHGYYYKVLTRQGPSAPGGELNYVVNGKMIGGFALVAYPAEYGNSGVMTFLVNHSGVVFQRDLGPSTAQIASQLTTFNPDHTWKRLTADEMGALK